MYKYRQCQVLFKRDLLSRNKILNVVCAAVTGRLVAEESKIANESTYSVNSEFDSIIFEGTVAEMANVVEEDDYKLYGSVAFNETDDDLEDDIEGIFSSEHHPTVYVLFSFA